MTKIATNKMVEIDSKDNELNQDSYCVYTNKYNDFWDRIDSKKLIEIGWILQGDFNNYEEAKELYDSLVNSGLNVVLTLNGYYHIYGDANELHSFTKIMNLNYNNK